MNCRNIQENIIQHTGPLKLHPERKMIESHLARCPDCRAWLEDLETIRESVRTLSPPPPSAHLVALTRSLCRDRLNASSACRRPIRLSDWVHSLPGFIKWALPPLVLFTIGWILGTIGNLRPDTAPTAPAVISLVLIVQNVAMLLLAPILLRQRGRPETVAGFR